ncbi:MAG: hypothetical protein P8166_14175 [Candidatus Thiodiazotropha sp.]
MKRPSRRQRRLVILSLALLAFGLAYYSGSRYQNRPRPTPAIAGVAIHPPPPLSTLPKTEGLTGSPPTQNCNSTSPFSICPENRVKSSARPSMG